MDSPVPTTQTDWNAIRDSYLQSIAVEEIAQEHGISVSTIRNRATKMGWAAMRSAASALARAEKSEEARACLVENIMRDIRRWKADNQPSPETDEYDRYSRNRERLVSTAARLFGWELDKVERDTHDSWKVAAIDIESTIVPRGTLTDTAADTSVSG